MCDYSLHAVSNRLAVEGESLVVHKFHSGSKGLASPADLEAVRPRGLKGLVRSFLFPEKIREARRGISAVCIPPGARLMLTGIGLGTRQELDVDEVEEVTFAQITNEPFSYRDAFKFANGRTQLVQLFHEGVCIEIVSLELKEEAEAVAEKPVEREVSANA